MSLLVVLLSLHEFQVRDHIIELRRCHIRMRGHDRVAKRQRVFDEGPDDSFIAVFQNIPRHVQIRTDLAAGAIERMAGQALNPKDLETKRRR